MAFFKTEAINERLIEEVKDYIEQENRLLLENLIDEMRPADVADLIEHLKPDERLFLFKLLEPEGAGEVLVEIEPPVQERIISGLDNEAISEIVEELDSDDAADIVGDLPAERAREIIKTVGDDVSEELGKLLPYAEDTAGGIMALEFVAIRADAKVMDAVETIREKREEVENLYYLWVVDDFERLAGLISLKDLLLESPDRKVSDIMNPEVISVHTNTDQEEVVRLVKKYDLVSIPVVDEQHRLVGRITHDDIIDVIEEEVDEDISLMAGVINQEIAEESPLKISRARLPWLIVGLLGGILAAAVISQFESSLERILALSFFFPVVMAMGGNTGTQAATVAVRGLATGDISLVNIEKRLWMEMKVALVNGIICGILLGLIVGFWLSDYWLGAVVATALILIILNSGFIGAAVPLVLKRLNIDPAIATGPFVTTSNDILSLLIYLGLVTVFLRLTA
ncbi:MAG: magnesium transporter [Deltaproteobacteria bacterium]|nr:magnesium transporter [Deltaproteobacteria bacterium]MBW1911360.1 magnesium transporter [Deltaproteobacteria bacterium]